MGWNEQLRGYTCRILVVPPRGGGLWYAWPKDLPVANGVGATEREAIDDLKANLKKEIAKVFDSDPPGAVPWMDVSCVLPPGDPQKFIKWVLVDGKSPPKRPEGAAKSIFK